MQEEKDKTKAEMIKVEVLLPKEVYEFVKAAAIFGKWKESLAEYLGYQIICALRGDFGNCLEGLFDMKELISGYGLYKKGIDVEAP